MRQVVKIDTQSALWVFVDDIGGLANSIDGPVQPVYISSFNNHVPFTDHDQHWAFDGQLYSLDEWLELTGENISESKKIELLLEYS